MDRRWFAATCAVALAAASLHAQSPVRGAKAATESPTRTPWGHPDLQGRWTNATLTPLERPAEVGSREFFTEAEAAEYETIALEVFLKQNSFTEEAAISGEFVEGLWVEGRTIVPTRRTSLIVGPTGRVPSFTPEAQRRAAARAAARKADRKDGPEDRPVGERCLYFSPSGPPMLPAIGYNSNYEILQTPTHVAIRIEMGGAFRTIPLDGRPHVSDRIRPWHGDSRGRWEGDTLVVETTNFNDKRELRGSSDRLRLVERFRRVDKDTLLYEFTAEDPTTWTAPWTAEVPMRTMDGLLYEFACHEANYSMANVLKGARFTEAEARRQ